MTLVKIDNPVTLTLFLAPLPRLYGPRLYGLRMYGPWTIDEIISDRNEKKIAAVSTDVKGSWVIKIQSNKCLEELTDFMALVREPPRNMVAVPPTAYELFGLTPTESWYAMKRYDGHLTKAHSHMWRQVGIACIQFLSDLHCIHRKVYMDFRLENILVSGSTVAVADYELVTSVSPELTSKSECSTRWYFYARGAERDAPLYSWRQDLVSLGYILVQLTAELPFFDDLMSRRVGRRVNHKSTKLLLAERDRAVLAQANPTLVAYFTKIKEVDWFAQDPPSTAFYEELTSLLRSHYLEDTLH